MLPPHRIANTEQEILNNAEHEQYIKSDTKVKNLFGFQKLFL